MDSKSFIERHWHSLCQYKYRWEFIRRSEAFKKDTSRYFNSGCTLFVDIWDLPHPGVNCVGEYIYLPDFKELLINTLDCFSGQKSEHEAQRDIWCFARALGGDCTYYDAPHSLVSIYPFCQRRSSDGGYVKDEIYFECRIRMTPALEQRTPTIINRVRESFPLMSHAIRSAGVYPRSILKLKIAAFHNDAKNYEPRLRKLVREVLNEGLEPMTPWQRKRKKDLDIYDYQLCVLDVSSGKMDREELYDRYDEELVGVNKDCFHNHLRQATKKIQRLEEQAILRITLLH